MGIHVIRQTRTYAVLQIGSRAYREIKSKLVAAGYEHTFQKDEEHGEVIDMSGIALAALPVRKRKLRKGMQLEKGRR